MDISGTWIQGTGQYEVKQTAVDDGVLKKGDFYLECLSSGTVAKFSDQAYGEWEFDLYKNASGSTTAIVKYISPDITDSGTSAYKFEFFNNERVLLNVSGSNVMYTTTSYIVSAIWYRVKITRLLDGTSTFYIKGGGFGEQWTLVDVTGGLGSNPYINNNITESQYFLLDFDAGDRIANLITRKAVRQ